MTSQLVAAVRAYTERESESSGGRKPAQGWPDSVLVFDTETTMDPAQRLLFGAYRYLRWQDDGSLRCVEEGLFHADELAEWRPDEMDVLEDYVRDREAVSVGVLDQRMPLHSRSDFVEKVFYKAAYQAEALVVGFNLPFDLSRIAAHAGIPHRGFYRGGFSLALAGRKNPDSGQWQDHPKLPRVRFKTLDSKRSIMGFGSPRFRDRRDPKAGFRGRFLDLRTLCFALTNRSYSLDRACKAYGVEDGKGKVDTLGVISPDSLDYGRQDVAATASLLEELRKEFDQHPIDLDPDSAYSPASVAKAYLRAMGVTPPREQFESIPNHIHGKSMSAYFGGRAECRIRRTSVPVVYLDFLSMYPTVNTLMGLWDVLTAEDMEVQDVTEEVQGWLRDVDLQDAFEPDLWQDLLVLVEVEPEGDILPVRAEYDPARDSIPTIGVNPLTSEEPLWYTAADLLASKILTGDVPDIRRALRLVPDGTQSGLKQVQLGGEVEVDPTRDDFFKAVIEKRKQGAGDQSDVPDERRAHLDAFLKVLANAGSYGIFAEMNRDNLPESQAETVQVYSRGEPYEHVTRRPEEPGEFCFPPLAAFITGAARLMLALAEKCVTDRGGTYAFCDTDSLAVVGSPEGGQVTPDIQAVSWSHVDEILDRFKALNPYSGAAGRGSILEKEKQNFADSEERTEQLPLYCHGISSKRYVLFNRPNGDAIRIRKFSEHGLGYLLNPRDPDERTTAWIEELWRRIICEGEGREAPAPDWFDRPAVSRLPISSPHYLEPFEQWNEGKEYPLQIKPMNFMLSAYTQPYEVPDGYDATQFHLIAPFEKDPAEWLEMDWIDRYSGDIFQVTTREQTSSREVGVESYKHVYEKYLHHPESKSLAPDGGTCTPDTTGLLKRRPLEIIWLDVIGKESNELESVESGLIHRADEVQEVYNSPSQDFYDEVVVPWMKTRKASTLAEIAGISERHIRALRNRRASPSVNTRRSLERAIRQEYASVNA